MFMNSEYYGSDLNRGQAIEGIAVLQIYGKRSEQNFTVWTVLRHCSRSTEGHGLKAFQASFSAPNTPIAIILYSNVVFLTLSYENVETCPAYDGETDAPCRGVIVWQ